MQLAHAPCVILSFKTAYFELGEAFFQRGEKQQEEEPKEKRWQSTKEKRAQ